MAAAADDDGAVDDAAAAAGDFVEDGDYYFDNSCDSFWQIPGNFKKHKRSDQFWKTVSKITSKSGF